MLLKTNGKTHLIEDNLVGVVTRDWQQKSTNEILIAENNIPEDVSSYMALITNLRKDTSLIDKSSVYEVGTTDHLSDGDIVSISTDGVISTLFRPYSEHNFLLFTERCNSNCLMCSQPPKAKDDAEYLYSIYSKLIPLIPKECRQLGITGGEPTLLGEKFFQLIELIKEELPGTYIHCLTNGRTFAWPNMVKRLARIECTNLMLAIPLYSDYYKQHDYIVQAKDAFHQTMKGLYFLAEHGQRIEIRIVLHLQVIDRVMKLANYIYRNLPFVEHVTFMGLEYQGYTPYNISKLWIDPEEYGSRLEEAVLFLSQRGMNVSIYNSQLCVLPKTLWPFMRRSISDWKNIYLDECNKCSLQEQCGGFFASNKAMYSKSIKAFRYE